MPAIRHFTVGQGRPVIILVHGFACAHTDWAAQAASLSARYQVISVDLPGHGGTPADPADCSIERFGADVAEIARAHAGEPVVLVGHSMGCRVVIEAALQYPAPVAGLVLVDGSQFSAAVEAVLREAFARAGGYAALLQGLFRDMFTADSDRAQADAVIARAGQLPHSIGERLLLDLQRYDVHRLTASLGCLGVPVMAIQTTTRDEAGRMTVLHSDQSSAYLAMLRRTVARLRIEVIPKIGHFPQLDAPARTTALLEDFLTLVRQ